jgi:hypothetical protein
VPLIFVLKDLQNADKASFVLIEMLMNSVEDVSCPPISPSKGLFMVATYVSNGDKPISDPFKSFLQQGTGGPVENLISVGLTIRTQHQNIHHISLSNLSWDDVHEWTQNTGGIIQRLSTDQKRAVTNLVFHHTNGNPVHTKYLLHLLQADKMLLSGPIHKKAVPSTVVALYTSILLRQDSSVVHVVRCAALLCHHSESEVVDRDILQVAMMKPCVDELLQAQESGLLEFFPSRGYIRFCRKTCGWRHTKPSRTVMCFILRLDRVCGRMQCCL